MLRSYFIAAVRNLMKHRLTTAINVIGLTIGLAACLVVIGYISYEQSFESFHPHHDRIYRVDTYYSSPDDEVHSARTAAPLGRAMPAEIPEVEQAAVFRQWNLYTITIDQKRTRIDYQYRNQGWVHGLNIIFADADFFDLFPYPLKAGNSTEILNRPGQALVTESAARKYFRDTDPIGQTVILNDSIECRIGGILEELPQNTHIYCDFMVSYATLATMDIAEGSWDNYSSDYVFVKLREGASPEAVESKLAGIVTRNIDTREYSSFQLGLMPLDDMHFDWMGVRGNLDPVGEVSLILTLAMFALFIIIQAVASFVNLSTAKASERFKEVGVRKVLGAFRSQLIKQFIGEAMVITIIATTIALAIYEVFRATINPMIPRDMFADLFATPLMPLYIVLLVVEVGVLAGFYPALYLSRFSPIAVLQGKGSGKSKRALLRKGLVVFQFAIAVCFVACTIIIYKQVTFIRNVDIGFNRENIAILEFEIEHTGDPEEYSRKNRLVKAEVVKDNHFLWATSLSSTPGTRSYSFCGFYPNDERRREDMIVGSLFQVDHDFLSSFDLEIVRGRGFSPDIASDREHAIIVNEGTVAAMGLDNPIGARLYTGSGELIIIGVVEKFQGTAMDFFHKDCLFIRLNPDNCRLLAVKLRDDDIAGSIMALRDIWTRVLPNENFTYKFLDDEIDAAYSESDSVLKMIMSLSLLTIVIACLGIYGLVSFTAARKTKEIGIRKVLGASPASIIKLLSREFILLVIFANIIAWPVAFLIMDEYLSEFAMQVSIGFEVYLLTVLAAVLLAVGSAGFQAYKAARANPIDSLRYE